MAGPKNTEIKAKKWQDPSKFKVTITGAGAGIIGGFTATPDLTLACTAVSLAEINTTPVDEWIGEEWRFATGRLENMQFTLTFKDYDNFTLYRGFAKAIQTFSRMYPNDQKCNIEIETADEFDIEAFVPLAKFKDSILITVSGPTLDNSAVASIAEFSVTFKTSYVEL
jgi:hypothetical protein